MSVQRFNRVSGRVELMTVVIDYHSHDHGC
jgi:hypothetical protein